MIAGRLQSDFAVDKVERELLHGILSGRYQAHECLPSIERLCEHYGVAYQTIRFALGRLVARGLVVAHPGEGTRVLDLRSSMDLKLLLEVIDQSTDAPARKWDLATQACGFLRFILSEIADRAARNRDDEQLDWLRHYIRLVSDRVWMKSTRREIGGYELEVSRVLAGASGCLTYTATINSMRSLFLSELLVADAQPLVPVDEYWALVEAVAQKDSVRAREIIDTAWWRLEAYCIEELKKLGWTETPTGATPGEP